MDTPVNDNRGFGGWKRGPLPVIYDLAVKKGLDSGDRWSLFDATDCGWPTSTGSVSGSKPTAADVLEESDMGGYSVYVHGLLPATMSVSRGHRPWTCWGEEDLGST